MMNQQINTKLPNGSTVLHNAARIGNVNNVRLLLSQGADVNATDAEGKKPLEYASNPEIKELLISSANVHLALPEFKAEQRFSEMKKNIKNEDDKNKLINGLIINPEFYSDIVKELIEFFLNNNVNLNIKTNITIPTIGGESIFNHALTSRDKWLLEKLLSKGVNIGEGVLLRNPFDHSIEELVKIGVDKEKIVYALKKYNSHIDEQIKINTIQKYLGAKSAKDYKDMDVNDYNSPDEEGFAKNTHEKLLKDVMQRLKNGEAKDGIINTIFEFSVDSATKEELIDKVIKYDFNDNNPVAAPALVIPVAAPTAPASLITSEKELSAYVRARLDKGENAEGLINFVSFYQGISDETRDNLIDEICKYSFGTELAGQIGSDIHF